MPKFVIEREIPGVGSLSAKELQAISQKSCGVLHEMGSTLQVDDLRFDWRGVLPGGALDEPVDR